MKQTSQAGWLLFVLVDAGEHGASRARVWRALKTLGPAILRDGVYLVPQRDDLARALDERRAEVRQSGGNAYVFSVARSDAGDPDLRALFDRSAEFTMLAQRASTLATETASEAADGTADHDRARVDSQHRSETDARRMVRALQREFAALVATEYFPNGARGEAGDALARAERALVDRFSPGEPRAAAVSIVRRERAAFAARTWATRERLWVDRLASAWLIRRFIDPQARFVWLADVRDRPSDAVGFDFDGATFTHVGELVTFEVLVRSFDLHDDAGLARLGAMVRSLDVPGSTRSAEAAGFEAMLAGARERTVGDDALLEALSPPMDFLYAAFSAAGDASGPARAARTDAS